MVFWRVDDKNMDEYCIGRGVGFIESSTKQKLMIILNYRYIYNILYLYMINSTVLNGKRNIFVMSLQQIKI